MARQLPLKQQQQQLDGGRVSCVLLCSNGVEFLLSLSLARSLARNGCHGAAAAAAAAALS